MIHFYKTFIHYSTGNLSDCQSEEEFTRYDEIGDLSKLQDKINPLPNCQTKTWNLQSLNEFAYYPWNKTVTAIGFGYYTNMVKWYVKCR